MYLGSSPQKLCIKFIDQSAAPILTVTFVLLVLGRIYLHTSVVHFTWVRAAIRYLRVHATGTHGPGVVGLYSLCLEVLYYVFCDMMEHLIHVESAHGRSFEKCEAVFGSESTSTFAIDLDLICEINLVGYQDLLDIRYCMLLNLFKPILDIGKGVLLCHVIYQQNAHSSLVIRLRDCAESFLASSVPYLQLD